jgi:hypothetical protein
MSDSNSDNEKPWDDDISILKDQITSLFACIRNIINNKKDAEWNSYRESSENQIAYNLLLLKYFNTFLEKYVKYTDKQKQDFIKTYKEQDNILPEINNNIFDIFIYYKIDANKIIETYSIDNIQCNTEYKDVIDRFTSLDKIKNKTEKTNKLNEVVNKYVLGKTYKDIDMKTYPDFKNYLNTLIQNTIISTPIISIIDKSHISTPISIPISRKRKQSDDKEGKKVIKDFDEFDFVKEFYKGTDEYKKDDLFRSLAIADSVHDNETRQVSISNIIRLFYEQPNLQLSSNIEYNILEEDEFIKYITKLNKNLSITGSTNSIIDFIDNDHLTSKFHKDIPTQLELPKKESRTIATGKKSTNYEYYPIYIINQLRNKYIHNFGTDTDIIGNLVDATGVKMSILFYNTIKHKNENYIEIDEETRKWDMATKSGNSFQRDKYCDCKRDFYYTKKTSERTNCEKIKDIIASIDESKVFNSINTFMKTNTIKINNIDTSIKDTVDIKEIDYEKIFDNKDDINSISINSTNYNILSFNLLKNNIKLNNFIEVDKSWNIYEQHKRVFDYTPYKFKPNKSWIDLINLSDFKYIRIPTISSVNFYITSDYEDNCNSYIFFIRNTNSVILKVNNSKRGREWNEFNISFIKDLFLDLLLNNNNIIIDEFVYFAKLLGYKLSIINNNDKEYLSKTYYNKNDGTIALKYEVDTDSNIIKLYKYTDYINYLNIDKNNTQQFQINGKLDLLNDPNIIYIRSDQPYLKDVIIPVTKIIDDDINDFIKLLLDLKRSGDWSQAQAVYNYNYKTDEEYKKSIGIKTIVFTTFDRLASLYARILDIPHMFYNKKDNCFEIYKPILEDKKTYKQSTIKRLRTAAVSPIQSLSSLLFFKQTSLFCGKEALNNLLCNIDFIRNHFRNDRGPLIIHDIDNIKISKDRKSNKYRFNYFYNNRLNLFTVALNHLLNLEDISFDNQNKPTKIKFKIKEIEIEIKIDNDNINIQNNDNKLSLNQLLEEKEICNIDTGNYADFIIKSALCKINNHIYGQNSNTKDNFLVDSFKIFYDKDNNINDLFLDNIVSNDDTLGYNILFSSVSNNSGHWISIKCFLNNTNNTIQYILFNSLEDNYQDPVDKLGIIEKLKGYYNNSNIIIYKLTKTNDKHNQYLQIDQVINRDNIKTYYNNPETNSTNISNNVQVNIMSDISKDDNKIEDNLQTKVIDILDNILKIIKEISETILIEDPILIQLEKKVIETKNIINEQYSIAQTKASTENHYYYRGLIKMASRLVSSYEIDIDGNMYSIKLLIDIFNNNKLNTQYKVLREYIDKSNKYIVTTIINTITFIEKGQNSQLSDDTMIDGGAYLYQSREGDNEIYHFHIFEDLYYSLYDTDINIIIPAIFVNCSKLVNFYLEYMKKTTTNNVYDIILLLLDVKQDILDAIERNDYNMINILQGICSCLSLYNDAYILTLSNINIKMIQNTILADYDVTNINKIEDKIERYDIKDVTMTITKLNNFLQNRLNELKKEYYHELKYSSEPSPLEISRQRMGYVTGFTSAAAAGGGNISQLYIEYFMKNPNKIKKEDKENIRNILKDEHFDDELVDFINLHLKL